jgi:hypothetical protein
MGDNNNHPPRRPANVCFCIFATFRLPSHLFCFS